MVGLFIEWYGKEYNPQETSGASRVHYQTIVKLDDINWSKIRILSAGLLLGNNRDKISL